MGCLAAYSEKRIILSGVSQLGTQQVSGAKLTQFQPVNDGLFVVI